MCACGLYVGVVASIHLPSIFEEGVLHGELLPL